MVKTPTRMRKPFYKRIILFEKSSRVYFVENLALCASRTSGEADFPFSWNLVRASNLGVTSRSLDSTNLCLVEPRLADYRSNALSDYYATIVDQYT